MANIYRTLNYPLTMPKTWHRQLSLILTAFLEVDIVIISTLQMRKNRPKEMT